MSGLGYFLGYILGFFLDVTQNYGLAMILFTISINVLMIPMVIKRQKSLATTTRLSKKQNEIKKKYANDRKKIEEETAKLYQKEGYNPMGGCLIMFVPIIILFGVIGTVFSPLKNTLHLPADKVKQASTLLSEIPGIENNTSSRYDEISIITLFPAIKEQLTMFNEEELQSIEEFSKSFNFLGLDLLATPKTSSWSSMLWVIPLFCLIVPTISTFITQKLQNDPSQQNQPGCMKYSMYFIPLMSVWISYTVPAAVGFYWIINGACQAIQTITVNHFYSPKILTAKSEIARIKLLEQQEQQEEKRLSPKHIEENEDKNANKGKKKRKN